MASLRAVQSQTSSALMQNMDVISAGIQVPANGAFTIYDSDLVMATNRTTTTTNRRVRALPPMAA